MITIECVCFLLNDTQNVDNVTINCWYCKGDNLCRYTGNEHHNYQHQYVDLHDDVSRPMYIEGISL